MAPEMVFVFFLTFFLRVSYSLPIASDVKTVQTNSETVLTEKVLEVEIILNLDEKTKFMQGLTTENVLNAFGSDEADHGKRVKRNILIPGVHCAGGTIPYGGQCVTKEKFAELNNIPEGEEVDVDGDDYVADP